MSLYESVLNYVMILDGYDGVWVNMRPYGCV